MNRYIRNRRAVIALALGLTTIPTVALAATDAVPGDPFKLGQDNQIEKVATTLTGTGQGANPVLQLHKKVGGTGIGPVLKVVNDGPGIGRRGIDIDVPAGQVPISVPPDAGKASFLNADKLDGKDKDDFLSSSLYGNGTSTLVLGPGGGKTMALTAQDGLTCDNNDIALSAGATALDADDDLVSIKPFKSSYQIQFQDNGAPGKFSANILCVDLGQPHRP